MMFQYSFKLNEVSNAINDAVLKVLESGLMTQDIATENAIVAGCEEMGDAVAEKLLE